MKGISVIGANFGDEGKGLMTDYFAAANAESVVIRYNGGAQAGHTVVTPEGQRHVFHHFGSGTLVDAPTYLSEHYILNPVLFRVEREELGRLGAKPFVFADPKCIMTVISDMMLNQWAEEARGHKRHGSCGVGINETVVRHERMPHLSTIYGLDSVDALFITIKQINKEWVPLRAQELGFTINDEQMEYLDMTAHRWCEDYTFMRRNIKPVNIRDLRSSFETVIFEGAQGLALDQSHKFFPHVTRSNTGSKNIVELAHQLELTRLDTTYVTRSYLTRHGAGPLPGEIPGVRVEDETNVPHPFQGTLRFAYLDLDFLNESITNDRLLVANIPGNQSIAITHMDKVKGGTHFVAGGRPRSATQARLASAVGSFIGMNVDYLSYGPTRNDVVENGNAARKTA